MAKNLTNPLKAALRSRMKGEVLKSITPESMARQSKAVTEKVSDFNCDLIYTINFPDLVLLKGFEN